MQTPIYNPGDMVPAAAVATHDHVHTHPGRMVIGLGAVAGALTANQPDMLRLRNYWAATITLTELHYEVRIAPTGSGITVLLKQNGATVHTATINAGATRANYTGLSIAWAADDSLEILVTAVGSTTPGSTLTGIGVGTTAGS